ncbi:MULTISPECIES: hypothetical protein [Methylobacterium]|uniref:Uncharacterized protein n=1 Tax=Methylobacterium jeotgali TaxID=381630 RepID=A0ABQ4SVE8_9HYPH|nr:MULTISPECIES: hypothetical protein [Methylobacterium]GBU18428.1 hypothetical protein AwMethylo_26430 [Methylobacterium sp.]GJE05843.1 hypothetical protein AOPFMNJM_1149 [Methylobacterium jeotgali]
MRNLIGLLVVLAAAFLLVGIYVAPNQPELRAWYRDNACVHLDKLSAKICEPIRKADGA